MRIRNSARDTVFTLENMEDFEEVRSCGDVIWLEKSQKRITAIIQ